MAETPTKVAIVIPVHNRRDTTLQALRSLSRIDVSDVLLQLIIVDDGSVDGTSEAIRVEFPKTKIVEGDGSLHYAAGTNRGIEAALNDDPDFVMTANDDAVFHEQFLRRMIRTSRDNPRSLVGALLLLWDEPEKVFQVDFRWKTIRGGWQQPHSKSVFEFPTVPFVVEGLAGNCVLIPVAAIRECGLMDARKFPHGWGDIQYFVRMREHGWRLMVDPRAFVWCEPNTYPAPLHTLPFSRRMQILFRDRRHPLNLHRQFVARWESAPSKAQALAAFAIYLGQLVLNFGKSVFRKKISRGA